MTEPETDLVMPADPVVPAMSAAGNLPMISASTSPPSRTGIAVAVCSMIAETGYISVYCSSLIAR
ncbi:MAG: hypothetical protein M1456_04175 [Actinobacteria bacterium]|nr:hypothetical protein [Actinomycetota bacterium]